MKLNCSKGKAELRERELIAKILNIEQRERNQF